MMWTRELNLSLMRAYYISTKVEEECESYRQRLNAEWKKKYPDSILDEQRVCSQLNSTIRRRVFSAAELEDLKREVTEVRQELTVQNPQEEDEEE
jgi:pyruvate dehydrogenase complex dehydrogenase (E1) component